MSMAPTVLGSNGLPIRFQPATRLMSNVVPANGHARLLDGSDVREPDEVAFPEPETDVRPDDVIGAGPVGDVERVVLRRARRQGEDVPRVEGRVVQRRRDELDAGPVDLGREQTEVDVPTLCVRAGRDRHRDLGRVARQHGLLGRDDVVARGHRVETGSCTRNRRPSSPPSPWSSSEPGWRRRRRRARRTVSPGRPRPAGYRRCWSPDRTGRRAAASPARSWVPSAYRRLRPRSGSSGPACSPEPPR
jgi:hypothetical protein